MKKIIAFIKPIMLDDVIFALHELDEFPGAAITEVKGIGRGLRDHVAKQERSPFHDFPKTIRMETVCSDEQAERIIETIQTNAHTGLLDDGKIYVSTVEDAIRIRTGERGNSAV